jgi:hypothetical protein
MHWPNRNEPACDFDPGSSTAEAHSPTDRVIVCPEFLDQVGWRLINCVQRAFFNAPPGPEMDVDPCVTPRLVAISVHPDSLLAKYLS